LFLFGLDKRIDGKASSIDDFFSKVSEKLDKDNAHILQQQVCYLNDGSTSLPPITGFLLSNNRLKH
jgi:hypothetical protein